ncbi:hypothetical protein MNEG_16654, partial [Monoraphidium neglectum]
QRLRVAFLEARLAAAAGGGAAWARLGMDGVALELGGERGGAAAAVTAHEQ